MALDDKVGERISKFYQEVGKLRNLNYSQGEDMYFNYIQKQVKKMNEEYDGMLPPIEQEHLERMNKSYLGEKDKAPLATPVGKLDGLSERTLNALNNASIKELDQILERSPKQLEKFRNFGRKALNEVRQAIHNAGYTNWGSNK